jgi:hypothetical protein
MEAAEPDLGWGSRPIGLALLGAGVLSRRGLGVAYAAEREPLKLQVLAGLALSDGETAEEDLSSLAAWLGCDLGTLGHVTRGMLPEELVERAGIEEEGDERIALTEAGGLVVEAWIARAVALFPG